MPNPEAGGPPLVGCPRLLIQFICSYPPYRRPFLHPQPEDAPCRGDRDPLITSQWSVLLTEYYAGGKIEKNEMGGAYGAYGAGERGVQGSGGET